MAYQGTDTMLMNKNPLDMPVLIHVCKDRTLTHRTWDQPVFNGKALPVYSVMTVEQAETLIALVGCKQYEEHPLLPGRPWMKINIGFKQYLELEDLDAVHDKLHEVFLRMR
jgi:hypothetical protein